MGSSMRSYETSVIIHSYRHLLKNRSPELGECLPLSKLPHCSAMSNGAISTAARPRRLWKNFFLISLSRKNYKAVSCPGQGSRGRTPTCRQNLPSSESPHQFKRPSALRTPAAQTTQSGCGGLRRKTVSAGPRKKLYLEGFSRVRFSSPAAPVR